METSLKKSLRSQIATNDTLKLIQEQQSDILDILGQLAIDAKNRKLLSKVKATAAMTPSAKVVPTSEAPVRSTSNEAKSTETNDPVGGNLSSLAAAARSGNQDRSASPMQDDNAITNQALQEEISPAHSEAAVNLAAV